MLYGSCRRHKAADAMCFTAPAGRSCRVLSSPRGSASSYGWKGGRTQAQTDGCADWRRKPALVEKMTAASHLSTALERFQFCSELGLLTAKSEATLNDNSVAKRTAKSASTP